MLEDSIGRGVTQEQCRAAIIACVVSAFLDHSFKTILFRGILFQRFYKFLSFHFHHTL